MANTYICKRFIKRKMGSMGNFFSKAFKCIKPENFEQMTSKHP